MYLFVIYALHGSLDKYEISWFFNAFQTYMVDLWWISSDIQTSSLSSVFIIPGNVLQHAKEQKQSVFFPYCEFYQPQQGPTCKLSLKAQ